MTSTLTNTTRRAAALGVTMLALAPAAAGAAGTPAHTPSPSRPDTSAVLGNPFPPAHKGGRAPAKLRLAGAPPHTTGARARHGAVARAAHATAGVPQHSLGRQYCYYGQIRTPVPDQVYPWSPNTREYVYFRSDVYRWTGSASGWQWQDGSQWARGIAGPNGLEALDSWWGATFAWYDGSHYTDIVNPAWVFGLPRGTYEVLQQIVWGTHESTPHAEVPRFQTGSQFCTF